MPEYRTRDCGLSEHAWAPLLLPADAANRAGGKLTPAIDAVIFGANQPGVWDRRRA